MCYLKNDRNLFYIDSRFEYIHCVCLLIMAKEIVSPNIYVDIKNGLIPQMFPICQIMNSLDLFFTCEHGVQMNSEAMYFVCDVFYMEMIKRIVSNVYYSAILQEINLYYLILILILILKLSFLT